MTIKRCKDITEFRKEITAAVEKLLGDKALESEIQAATNVVVDAFLTCNSATYNGIPSVKPDQNNHFHAIANLHTGEFRLFREIVSC